MSIPLTRFWGGIDIPGGKKHLTFGRLAADLSRFGRALKRELEKASTERLTIIPAFTYIQPHG
jgi:hypothetical protein